MKRIAYSLLLLLALSPARGFAQGKMMWGFSLGFDISYRVSSGPHNTGAAAGVLGGLGIGYFNWKKFSVSAQIFLLNKGYSAYTGPIDGSLEIFHEYIEISSDIKIPLIERNLYVFAGPTVGIPLTQASPFDFGIYGGVGISGSLSNTVDMYLQISYVYGLQNLNNSSEHSREIRMSVGILIGE
jgi:hypothetical protein